MVKLEPVQTERLAKIISNAFTSKNGNRKYKFIVVNYDKTYFVKEKSDSENKYTETDIIQMLNFLIDNIFVVFGGKVFQQIVGIPMGTNCVPLLADIFLYSYEAEFIQSLVSEGKRYLASDFKFTYRYIDDVLSINNPKFADYLSSIYPSELEVKETTETNNSASYLDIMLSYDTDGHMNTSLYDKRDDFNFSITNFPFLNSNIPSSPAYGVFISQLIRYARASTKYTDFVLRARRLSDKLLSQGYVCDRLTSSLRKFYGRYGELVIHYDVPLSRMDGFLERLSSSEFVSLSREVENFVNDCESLCGRRSTSLRCSLQSQATKFVSRFHDERRTKLSLILDNERWKQADVPTEFQDLVDHVSKTDRKPGDTIKVDKENFAVVGTVLMLLKMMVEYCQCVDDIPSAAPDLLTRLVDLLKIFNSRTCQLVLGAGALQLVGLKTISTRNLALASRCLQLVVHYMPKVRTHFEDRLIAKNKTMLKHFDQVQKDYSDHINEISNKLVTVMEGVVSSQLVKWEVKAPMPSACFRAICKQLAKMHEALVDILPLDQVKDIFSRINQSFKVFIREQCIKLDVSRNGGPQHGLVMSDLAFYSGTFKTLRGLENLSCDMKEIFDGS
ncbi:hypothetical protein FSP39_012788 [Pinctada imbricata]|uniref:Vacuolar protein sorting-associated protein 54 n=1 Tax=Pinctada imbricata TaxID=66713 RepID=A0AA88XZU9_PINIB|nr:hypothetical protein FSP39_012788 [Pinctada imbricata]